jgi:glutathione S-transferase
MTIFVSCDAHLPHVAYRARMTDELVLYYNPMSRAQIAHWMLEEVGAPYRLELVRFDKREHKTASYLAINPMGKLPTLTHRGVVVTEAAAICAYLADAFPKANLAPAIDDPKRGTYFRWLFFGASTLEYAVFDKGAERANDQPSRIGYGTYEDTLSALEGALKPGPFVCGEQFTAADVYLGAQVVWGMMMKSIEPRPAFLEYQKHVTARPASIKVREQQMKYIEQIKAQQ